MRRKNSVCEWVLTTLWVLASTMFFSRLRNFKTLFFPPALSRYPRVPVAVSLFPDLNQKSLYFVEQAVQGLLDLTIKSFGDLKDFTQYLLFVLFLDASQNPGPSRDELRTTIPSRPDPLEERRAEYPYRYAREKNRNPKQ